MPELHFDRVASVYAHARPPYPPKVYEHLERGGLVLSGARLLEIGAGTGQATVELVRRGATVDAIEPGPSLAAALRAHERVRVIEAAAEDVGLEDAAYDGIAGATSLHWVDVPALLPAWHRALRPGGVLAAWWTVFGDEETTPFRERVDAIAEASGRGRPAGEVERPLRIAERVAELEGGGLFACIDPLVLRWRAEMTPAALRALFTTFPTWGEDAAALDAVEAAAAACVGPGGTVTEHYRTAVYVALARHSSASSA